MLGRGTQGQGDRYRLISTLRSAIANWRSAFDGPRRYAAEIQQPAREVLRVRPSSAAIIFRSACLELASYHYSAPADLIYNEHLLVGHSEGGISSASMFPAYFHFKRVLSL